jgi:anti-anti-sigma factor
VSITEDRADGRLRIVVEGELDMVLAPELEAALGRAVESADAVTVDFAECSFIDSSGVRALVNTARSLGPEPPKLAIVGLRGQPRTIFAETLSYLDGFELDP